MTPRQGVALALIAALLYVFAVVLPRRSARMIGALREGIARDPAARFQFYLRYLRLTGVVIAVFVVTVAAGGEGFEAAGVGWPPDATLRLIPALYAGIVAAGLVIIVAQQVGRRVDPAAVDPARQFARVEFLVPETPRENAIWGVVSLAIAVLEECVYRGLFVLYAAALLDIGPWWLVVPSTVVFAADHRYQGWFGVVATGGLGIGFAIMTVGTGSLLPAVVMHAAFDYRLKFLRRRLARDAAKATALADPPRPEERDRYRH